MSEANASFALLTLAGSSCRCPMPQISTGASGLALPEKSYFLPAISLILTLFPFRVGVPLRKGRRIVRFTLAPVAAQRNELADFETVIVCPTAAVAQACSAERIKRKMLAR